MSNEIILNEKQETALVPVSAAREEVDLQISTARAYPRNIKTVLSEAMELATISQDTAAACYYKLPRGGKVIEGPSVRLSEIVASSYGNIRFGSSYIGETEDGRSVIAEGFCIDLQKNVACRVQTTRRIVDKHGKRYAIDVIETTKSAAQAIAKRQAIFNVVPLVFIKEIFEQCKVVATGTVKTLPERRTKAIEHFARYGVTQDRVLSAIGRPSIEAVTLDDLEALLGMATALRENEADIETLFPSAAHQGEVKGTLADKIAASAANVKAQTVEPEQIVSQESTTPSLNIETPAPKQGLRLPGRK